MTRFHGNRGTAIRAYRSTIGDNSFVNNSATEGGAIALLENSHLIIENNTEILFLNNYANGVGGAIYVHNYYTYSFDLLRFNDRIDECSLMLIWNQRTFYPDLKVNITLNFTNNTGWNGGDVVYGEDINTCVVHNWSLLKIMISYIQGIQVHFNQGEYTSFSLLSSDSMRVCACTNGRPVCVNVFMSLTKYPGETFNISTVVVGENFGTVSGSVYSKFLPLGENRAAPKLEELQHFQRVSRSTGCTELQYTVLSENEEEVMVLTAKDVTMSHYGSQYDVDRWVREYENSGFPTQNLLTYPVYVNITLLPCPLGFMLHSYQHRCVCHSQLEEHNIACNISDQTVHRSGSMWINASFAGNKTNGVIIHKYCPFDYCKNGEMNINLENPDDQCAFNHAGVLCGGCQKGLSLALGSSQCFHCSNSYIALLIPFATAGIVLVFFLTFLNLTVSQGTINGLIFYANVVKALFFPPGDTSLLTVFVSWLNLDLGIEMCFVDGLNGYWKTWLQFVFPVYIWVITATIIIASHYSSVAAKTFGNNSVPVLATLFLLSYAKLLRTIITTLTFTYLDYPDGSRKIVWSYDGNVAYFSPSHILLFLVAIAFLSFLWLPYTGILLFKQYLQKYTNYKCLHWITKMKPFFDAYFGPFKDKHWYWVGVMLLVRVILLLTFAIAQDPNIGLLVTVITGVMVLLSSAVLGGVYRKWYLSIWEYSFILNLIILSLTSLYIQASGGNQAALVYTAVGIMFAQFVAIVFCHVLMKREVRRFIQRWYLKLHPNKAPDRRHTDSETLNQQQVEVVRQPTHNSISLYELREPLLTDN